MPKIVDPGQRRRAVVDAVFAVVRRDGFERASLRNIADEAGLAIGSIRHYFAGHDELMVFAMREMVERIGARILARADGLRTCDDPAERRARTEKLLAEFLPLDEHRFDEAVVWLEFATAARTRPSLRPHAEKMHDGTRRIIRLIVERAARDRPAVDVDTEVERLAALIDGLTMAGVLHPGSLPPERARAAVAGHLRTLADG